MNQTWFQNLNTQELIQFTQNMEAEIGFFGGRYYRTEKGAVSLNDIFLHHAFKQAQNKLDVPILNQLIKNLQVKDREGENLLEKASLFQKILTYIKRWLIQEFINRAQIIKLSEQIITISEQNISYHFEQVIPFIHTKISSKESQLKIRFFEQKLAATSFQELYEFLKSLNEGILKNNVFIALAKYMPMPFNTLVFGLSRVDADEHEKNKLLNELIPVLLANKPFYNIVNGIKRFNQFEFWTINILIDFRFIFGCKNHQNDTPPISPLLAKHIVYELQPAINLQNKKIQAALPRSEDVQYDIGVQLVLQQKSDCRFPTSLILPLLEEMINLDGLIGVNTNDLQRFDYKAESICKKLDQKCEENLYVIRHDPLYNIRNGQDTSQKLL